MPELHRSRKTLSEMIREGRQGGSREGLKCPKCGCPDLPVKVTWKSDGKVRRRRVCHNCGTIVPTYETTI